jgi:hypothetical protein
MERVKLYSELPESCEEEGFSIVLPLASKKKS